MGRLIGKGAGAAALALALALALAPCGCGAQGPAGEEGGPPGAFGEAGERMSTEGPSEGPAEGAEMSVSEEGVEMVEGYLLEKYGLREGDYEVVSCNRFADCWPERGSLVGEAVDEGGWVAEVLYEGRECQVHCVPADSPFCEEFGYRGGGIDTLEAPLLSDLVIGRFRAAIPSAEGAEVLVTDMGVRFTDPQLFQDLRFDPDNPFDAIPLQLATLCIWAVYPDDSPVTEEEVKAALEGAFLAEQCGGRYVVANVHTAEGWLTWRNDGVDPFGTTRDERGLV